MRSFLTVLFLTFCATLAPHTATGKGMTSIHSLSSDIEDWWTKCGGSAANSTCLQNRELSRFKTLCMNEINKADCKTVIDFVVAKSRLVEAKKLLLSGKSSLRKIFLERSAYPKQPESIWDSSTIDIARSFAVGILPSCLKDGKKKLLFGSNMRPEVDELREDLQRYYEKLSYLPCPKGEPVLVVVGLIHDSKPVFDTYTVDSENKFKTISSSLRDSPFSPETDEIASYLQPK